MKRTTYLDNAATTPVQPEVLDAMLPFLGPEKFGNPSSTHQFGREARAAIEGARRQVAEPLGAEPKHVIFASGGTEADNLAVIGGALAARDSGKPFRVAVSAIEHEAVLSAARSLEAMGGEVVYLPVDENGAVSLDALDDALELGVGLVSIMWVNNEVGAVQDIQSIAEQCASANTTFHTDAVQAIGKIPCAIPNTHGVAVTISGHKVGAPKGIGALILRDDGIVQALLHGGGQQRALRPGTENVPGIVGLGMAVEMVTQNGDKAHKTLADLRDRLESGILSSIPDSHSNAAGGHRAPHICNISIPGADNETMLMHLDLAGIACSSGSACKSGSTEISHVMKAMGVNEQFARTALRFSFSHNTTQEDVDSVLEQLPAIVKKVRSLNSALRRN